MGQLMTSISRKLVLMVIDEFILPELLKAKHSDWCSCKFLSSQLKRIPVANGKKLFAVFLHSSPKYSFIKEKSCSVSIVILETFINVLSSKCRSL